jgi:hypothetical protein
MAELDRLAFGSAGMGHYGESHVRCWLQVNPEGLLVASQRGTAVACCYSQYVDFSPEDVSLDPVLNKYLKNRGAEVAAVHIDWLEDPASCNCSALVAIRNPGGAPAI